MMAGPQGEPGFITPVATANGHLAVHSGESLFMPGKQLLISQVSRGRGQEALVRGRIGLHDLQYGQLALVLTESAGAAHRVPVTPEPARPGDSASPEQEANTDQWPSFTAAFAVGIQQLRRAGTTARFELTVGGRSYESTIRLT